MVAAQNAPEPDVMGRFPLLALILAGLSVLAAPAATTAHAEATAAAVARPGLIQRPDGILESGVLAVAARSADGATLVLDGVITAEVADRLDALLDALPPDLPLTLTLRSPGGYTTAGYRMMDRLLSERAAGRRITTRVGRGDFCESMCVGLFMAGEVRQAAPDAVFMVHAPRGLNTGAVTLRSVQRMVERLRDLGASTDWLEQVRAAGGFSGNVDYRIPAARLAADRSGVVTALEQP